MAIGAGTVTLADYTSMSNSPQVQAIAYSLILYSNIIQDIPLTTNPTMQVHGARFEGNLPSVNWSQLNAEGVTTKGTPTPYAEQVYILRNYIDVDKFIIMDKNRIVDQRAIQTEAWLKALTYDLNFKFFKNDHITGDVNAPVGLRARIDDAASANRFGVRPENKIDASGLDITQATLATTPSNGNKLIELMDQLLWSVDAPNGGPEVVFYMNDTFTRRFNYMLRQMGASGGLDSTRDQFDRVVQSYKGCTIRDPGLKVDQSTKILTNTETNLGADGASTMTSIYAVNYSQDHFHGWQMETLNVQDLGLINNGAIYRTLIDWAVGLINDSTRSIGRIFDIKIQ